MPHDHAHTTIPRVAEFAVGARAGWFLSVTDNARPEGYRFIGVWITNEMDLARASNAAWAATGRGPEVHICAVPYPQIDLDLVLPGDRDRLLSKRDLARVGENTLNAQELGVDL